MPNRSTEKIVSCKQAKFKGAQQHRHHGDSLSIRTPLTWLNLFIASVWFTCIIGNAVVLGSTRQSVAQSAGDAATDKVCTTEACNRAATYIKSMIDATEEPCNNFYKFACGGWIERTNLTSSFEYRQPSTNLDERKLKQNIRHLLESNVITKDPKVNRMVTNMRNYYKSCVDFESMGPANIRLNHIFSEIPLPYINSSGWENMPLERFVAELQILFNINRIFSTSIVVDTRNLSWNILQIDQPYVTYRKRLLGDEEFQERRKKLITDVLEKVYNDLNIYNVTVDADALLNLEMLIANASAPLEDLDRSKTDNRWTVSTLVSSMSNFNWSIYLERMMASEDARSTLSDDDNLTVTVPEYLEKLDDYLEKEIVKDTVGQLATFWLMLTYEYHLTVDYRKLFKSFKEYVTKKKILPDLRWKDCIYIVQNIRFLDVLSLLYSHMYFDQAAKTASLEMISDIKNAFYRKLKENTWMDESGKASAAKKVRKMVGEIGFPNYIYDEDFMQQKYGWMTVKDTGFLENEIQITKGIWTTTVPQLWTMNVFKDWRISPLKMNAVYSRRFNKFIIYMPMIAPPYFDKEYPKYLNYGGMGFVIGHEITHGFDHRGSRRDEYGILRPWWSRKTTESFSRAARCFVNQYSKYKAPYDDLNITVNGAASLGENIADNGGVKVAFNAYREWVKSKGKPESKLPGLDYTPEQLFFISYSQTRCAKISKKAIEYLLTRTSYLPNEFRVNGALSNNQRFQETFQCKPEDKMNAPKKCTLW